MNTLNVWNFRDAPHPQHPWNAGHWFGHKLYFSENLISMKESYSLIWDKYKKNKNADIPNKNMYKSLTFYRQCIESRKKFTFSSEKKKWNVKIKSNINRHKKIIGFNWSAQEKRASILRISQTFQRNFFRCDERIQPPRSHPQFVLL